MCAAGQRYTRSVRPTCDKTIVLPTVVYSGVTSTHTHTHSRTPSQHTREGNTHQMDIAAVSRNEQICPYRSCHKRRQLDTHVGCLLLRQLDAHVGRLLQRPSAPPSQEKGGSRIVVLYLLRVSRHLHESQLCPPCGIGDSPKQAALLCSANVIAPQPQRQSTPGDNAQCRAGVGVGTAQHALHAVGRTPPSSCLRLGEPIGVPLPSIVGGPCALVVRILAMRHLPIGQVP